MKKIPKINKRRACNKGVGSEKISKISKCRAYVYSGLQSNFNKPFQGFGTCPDSTCPNYIGGDEETIDVGNTTVIGGNIPGSGGYYPYGQQAGSFLVEDVLPEIMN